MVFTLTNPISAAAPHVFAATVKSPLQGRYLGGLVRLAEQMWTLTLLHSGRILVRGSDSEYEVISPSLIWCPPSSSLQRLYLCAGSTCEQVAFDDVALTNAIGHKPEAEALRAFSAQAGSHALAEHPELLFQLTRCMQSIRWEYSAKQPGSETIIEAHIRVVLVLLWRGFMQSQRDAPTVATRALILLKFRQNVEAHFRARWSVAQHAAALNVSVDRLHAICTDTLAKSPQQLIHHRLTHESRLLLRRSEMTLDQLAVYLGFKNSPQFNVFFKRHNGVPPGRYRKLAKVEASLTGDEPSGSYADWP